MEFQEFTRLSAIVFYVSSRLATVFLVNTSGLTFCITLMVLVYFSLDYFVRLIKEIKPRNSCIFATEHLFQSNWIWVTMILDDIRVISTEFRWKFNFMPGFVRNHLSFVYKCCNVVEETLNYKEINRQLISSETTINALQPRSRDSSARQSPSGISLSVNI